MVTIKVNKLQIETASFWTNDHILLFNKLLEGLGTTSLLTQQVKVFLKTMVFHSVFRAIESQVESHIQHWCSDF